MLFIFAVIFIIFLRSHSTIISKSLTLSFPMFPFSSLENIKKPLVFWEGSIGKKWGNRIQTLWRKNDKFKGRNGSKWWNMIQIKDIAMIGVIEVKKLPVVLHSKNNWKLFYPSDVIPCNIINYYIAATKSSAYNWRYSNPHFQRLCCAYMKVT